MFSWVACFFFIKKPATAMWNSYVAIILLFYFLMHHHTWRRPFFHSFVLGLPSVPWAHLICNHFGIVRGWRTSYIPSSVVKMNINLYSPFPFSFCVFRMASKCTHVQICWQLPDLKKFFPSFGGYRDLESAVGLWTERHSSFMRARCAHNVLLLLPTEYTSTVARKGQW